MEGIPTLLLVPVTFYFLPDSPDKARFLTAEEKLVAKARGVRQVGTTERVGGVVVCGNFISRIPILQMRGFS